MALTIEQTFSIYTNPKNIKIFLFSRRGGYYQVKITVTQGQSDEVCTPDSFPSFENRLDAVKFVVQLLHSVQSHWDGVQRDVLTETLTVAIIKSIELRLYEGGNIV